MVSFCLRWSNCSQEEERERRAAPDVPAPSRVLRGASRKPRGRARLGHVCSEALHELQGALTLAVTHQPLVPAPPRDTFSVSMWPESATSPGAKNNVLADHRDPQRISHLALRSLT